MSYIGASPDGKGSAERFLFTATGSTTDTVTHADSGLAISYEVNHVSVYLNGVKQVIGTGKDVVASNGSTLVFASNLAEHDVVEVIALSSFQPADTVSASTGGTFTGPVTFEGGTTTIKSVTLTIDDKNIEMGSVDSPTDSTADGGGITLKGTTDKTILWENDTDSWNFNQNIETSTTTKVKQKGAFMQSSTHQAWVMGG